MTCIEDFSVQIADYLLSLCRMKESRQPFGCLLWLFWISHKKEVVCGQVFGIEAVEVNGAAIVGNSGTKLPSGGDDQIRHVAHADVFEDNFVHVVFEVEDLRDARFAIKHVAICALSAARDGRGRWGVDFAVRMDGVAEEERVVARVAKEVVKTAAANQEIVARAAVENVVASATDQLVVAVSA